MSGFAEDWLTSREALDHEVRSARLADAFAAASGSRLLDLGTGTGSNIRYLAPRLGADQRWIALDHDPALLDAARRSFATFATQRNFALTAEESTIRMIGGSHRIEVTSRVHDLAHLAVLDLEGLDGVSAAALLDLTSAAWLDRLADRLTEAGTPALFALSFDGRLVFSPEDERDEEARRRLVLHQRIDKGFGPALGAGAVGHLAARLDRAGRRVELACADWCLNRGRRALTAMFLDGLADVLDETPGPDLAAWLARRRRDLKDDRLQIRVGHQDLLVA